MDDMLRLSAELDLDVWLLDEFNWPSGHCAGYVLRDQPWLRTSPLRRLKADARPEQSLALIVPGEVMSAVFLTDNQPRPVTNWRLETLPDATRLIWQNDTGRPGTLHVIVRAIDTQTYYVAHGAPWALGPQQGWGYADMLNDRAMAASLRYTAEQYALRFPKRLGTTIKGFFTDENVLTTGGKVPYTDGIDAEFARRYGRPLAPSIHELFIDSGDYVKTRSQYWSLVADWVESHHYRPYRQWCDHHGVALIGHLCGEESLGGNVQYNGDMYTAARNLSCPGVDMLYGITGYDPPGKWNRPGNHYAEDDPRSFHMTVKLAQSTAKHAGARRQFNEAFTCEDFATSPQALKRSCNYYAATGTNLLLLADFNYSQAGFRKRRGGSKCFGMPWNRYCDALTDYVARLSSFAATGRAAASVGVLYPRTTAWVQRTSSEIGKTQEKLDALFDALLRTQWPFDIVYEQILEESTVADGALKTPHEDYRVLFAVGYSTLPECAARKLDAFTRSGGTLIVVEPFGRMSPNMKDIEAWAKSVTARSNVLSLNVDWKNNAATRSRIDDELRKRLAQPLHISGPHAASFVTSHRVLPDAHLFLLANMEDERADVTVTSPLPGPWERWDLDTGRRFRLSPPDRSLAMTFAPGEAAILCIGGPLNPSLPAWAEYQEKDLAAVQSLTGPWRVTLDRPNELRLDPLIRCDEQNAGLSSGWGQKPDGPWEPLERHVSRKDIDAKFMPAYWLMARFVADHLPEALRLVVDCDLVTNLFVNGVEVDDRQSAMLWDKGNLACDIRPLVQHGTNVVVLRCRTERLNLERANDAPATPIVLLGKFSAGGSNILLPPSSELPPGPWHENGLPHFAGTVTYQRLLQWEGPAEGRMFLDLGKVGDCAEVTVNGIALAARCWTPYRFEMTRALKKGSNTLSIQITSGIGNLLPFGYTNQLVEKVVPYGLLDTPKVLVAPAKARKGT